MAATDARPLPKKNVAYRHYFAIRKNDGTLITTWTGQDSERSLDGAAFSDCTNEATEISSSGCGYIDLTAAEMNADAVLLKVTVTNTDALPYVIVLFPEEGGDIRVDVTQISGDSAAADNLEAACDAYSATAGLAGSHLDAAVSTRSSHTAANVRTEMDANSTKLAAIVADTNELQTDWTNGGRLDVILDARASQASVDTIDGIVDSILVDTNELQTDWANGGRLDLILDATASQASVDVIDGNVDAIGGIVTAILVDTDELQTDWANGGRLDVILDARASQSSVDTIDGIVDAILVDTDELQTDWADGGRLDSILDSAGSAGDPWGTSLPGAYGEGSAGYILGTNLDATVSSRSSHSAADVDTELTGNHGAGSWETGAGSTGAGARTITITIDDGTDPVENARVRLSEGVSTYIGVTDSDGEVTFNVDDATYTVAVSKAGYTFAGASLVVSADASPTYSMTAIVVPPAADVDRATGSIRVYDEEGNAEVGASVTVQIQQGPGTAGYGYDTTPWTEASDANGDVHFAGLVRGATYTIYRGTATRRGKTFVVPDEDTFDIAELLGAP